MRTMIASELGITSLPPEKQEEMISEIGDALFDRVTLAIWKEIPSEVLAQFVQQSKEQDVNDSSPQKVLEFIMQYEQYIPNFGKFIDDEIKAGLRAYRTFMLGAGAHEV